MDSLPIAAAIIKESAPKHARSALPDAPVVPYVEPAPRERRRTRARASLAAALYWAGGVLEPAECSQVR